MTSLQRAFWWLAAATIALFLAGAGFSFYVVVALGDQRDADRRIVRLADERLCGRQNAIAEILRLFTAAANPALGTPYGLALGEQRYTQIRRLIDLSDCLPVNVRIR